MIIRKKKGFTLIELMVALVVGGLLMASLVALSGAVQKSFGRSKEISELQSNLRFAIRRLSEDLGRAGFMYSVDPLQDCPPAMGLDASQSWQAIEYNPTTLQFNIRGNFQSTRDYQVQILGPDTAQIVCRDGSTYTPGTPGNPDTCAGYGGGIAQISSLILPFRDGSGFSDLFFLNQRFRMEDADNFFSYHQITGLPGNNTIQFAPTINRNMVRGATKWINPFTTITYRVMQDGAYNQIYSGAPASLRFFLQRSWVAAGNTNNVEIAEFLLPTNPLSVQVINDTSPNAGICRQPWSPQLAAPIPVVGAIDPIRARALIITLRGRTEMEDPDFTLPNPAAAQDYGVDLDNNPDNGLAHVRIESRVVELRNLTYSLTTN